MCGCCSGESLGCLACRGEKRLAFLSMSRVEPSSGCWLWLLATNKGGYGEVDLIQGETYAHRVAYVLFIGPVPPGWFVCHKCDHPRCVNPQHLFLGTARDNVQDSIAKGRFFRWQHTGMRLSGDPINRPRKSCCPYGHPYERGYGTRSGTRLCRVCSHRREKAYRLRKKQRQQGTIGASA